jgi:hypothetical protein
MRSLFHRTVTSAIPASQGRSHSRDLTSGDGQQGTKGPIPQAGLPLTLQDLLSGAAAFDTTTHDARLAAMAGVVSPYSLPCLVRRPLLLIDAMGSKPVRQSHG